MIPILVISFERVAALQNSVVMTECSHLRNISVALFFLGDPVAESGAFVNDAPFPLVPPASCLLDALLAFALDPASATA